jgi:DNA-binding SARP family transcriptional activator
LGRTNRPLSQHKVRALLAYLAFEPDPAQSRRVIMGLLWPEIADRQALNNLRVTLHRLRQLLDEAVPGSSERLLTITRHTVQLHSAEIEIDVRRFQQRLAAATTHPHPDLAACPDCLTQLGEAAGLYRGELLSGFGLVDAPAFEEWLLLRREMQQQQALTIFTRLAQAYETNGASDQALAYAPRLVDLDPYREVSQRIRVRLLALGGQPIRPRATMLSGGRDCNKRWASRHRLRSLPWPMRSDPVGRARPRPALNLKPLT